jgi:hypothetical protein
MSFHPKDLNSVTPCKTLNNVTMSKPLHCQVYGRRKSEQGFFFLPRSSSPCTKVAPPKLNHDVPSTPLSFIICSYSSIRRVLNHSTTYMHKPHARKSWNMTSINIFSPNVGIWNQCSHAQFWPDNATWLIVPIWVCWRAMTIRTSTIETQVRFPSVDTCLSYRRHTTYLRKWDPIQKKTFRCLATHLHGIFG